MWTERPSRRLDRQAVRTRQGTFRQTPTSEMVDRPRSDQERETGGGTAPYIWKRANKRGVEGGGRRRRAEGGGGSNGGVRKTQTAQKLGHMVQTQIGLSKDDYAHELTYLDAGWLDVGRCCWPLLGGLVHSWGGKASFFCSPLLCSPLFASVRPFLPPHQMSTKQQNVTHNVSPAVAAVDDTKDNSNETDAQLTVSEYYSLSRTLA